VSPRLCAISVDLDEIPNYIGIHGLEPLDPEAPAARAVYALGLARLDDFARANQVPLSLFAIGRDLDNPKSAATLRALADRGHAIENHSLDHRYDLTRLPADEIRHQIELGASAIQKATGRRPTGFRAPGYTITDTVFDALEELDVAFDSSVFPCPPYFALKAAVLASMRLRGRRSFSVLDTPRVLTAPTQPYRPGSPYFQRGSRRLVELPIQVTRGLRLPFIGTSIGLARPFGARLLARQCVGAPFVNLELHGIDFLDASDGLERLVPYQAELRRPLEERMLALTEVVRVMKGAGYSFVRLDEVAASYAKRS
jgi:hypothetical protein